MENLQWHQQKKHALASRIHCLSVNHQIPQLKPINRDEGEKIYFGLVIWFVNIQSCFFLQFSTTFFKGTGEIIKKRHL